MTTSRKAVLKYQEINRLDLTLERKKTRLKQIENQLEEAKKIVRDIYGSLI